VFFLVYFDIHYTKFKTFSSKMFYPNMSMTDESFREAFKPLHIPAHYADSKNDQDKVVYALAQLGEATPGAIVAKLSQIDPAIHTEQFTAIAGSVLNNLYDKGLIKGLKIGGQMHYDLSKITQANDGAINPDLLAPGLD
jgi:hypothetical protein